LRGTAKWQGDDFVNTWQETVEGKTAMFSDSFGQISGSSFQLVSEGMSDGKIIWRVITKYQRRQDDSQPNQKRD
jgi:hypothetical protein